MQRIFKVWVSELVRNRRIGCMALLNLHKPIDLMDCIPNPSSRAFEAGGLYFTIHRPVDTGVKEAQ